MSIHNFWFQKSASFSTISVIHYLWISASNAGGARIFDVNYGVKNVDIEKTIILYPDFSTNSQP